MNLFDFIPGYSQNIYHAGKEPALVMLLSFIITFLLTRFYTRMARRIGWGSTFIGETHVHHLVVGIFFVLLSGALLISIPDISGVLTLVVAGFFGAGAAFVLDEFALIFHLKDVYWEEQGRKSVDAIIIATILGMIFMLNIAPMSIGDIDISKGWPTWGLAIAETINLIFVVIAASKGKTYTAILGVFVPALAIIGATRLAQPNSIWARRNYPRKSLKLERAKIRHERYQVTWHPHIERIRDILGGKLHHHHTTDWKRAVPSKIKSQS